MCIDSRQCSLSLGTSSGYITCWDLRFQLPVATMAHPQCMYFFLLISHLIILCTSSFFSMLMF